ncbi:hypothetical protein NMG60_11027178 [Bertholletia excelsa]
MAMITPFLLPLLLSLSHLRLLSARPGPETPPKPDLIDKVCSQADNHPFCLKTLRSDPRSAGADLQGLAQVSIDLAHSGAENVYGFVHLLVKQATKARLKERYTFCEGNYYRTIVYIEEANDSFGSEDYQSMSVQASSAMEEVDACAEEFERPPPDTTRLLGRNARMFDLANIVYEIAMLLEEKS